MSESYQAFGFFVSHLTLKMIKEGTKAWYDSLIFLGGFVLNFPKKYHTFASKLAMEI